MTNWLKHFKKGVVLILCLLLSAAVSGCAGSGNSANKLKAQSFNEYSYTTSLTMPGESGVSFLNEKTEVSLEIRNVGEYRAKKGSVKFTFKSVYGGKPFKVTETFREYADDKAPSAVIKVPVKTDTFGYWTVDVDITIDGNKMDTISKGYCVVNTPQAYGKADKDNFFGVMGVHNNPRGAERIGAKTDRPSAYWRFMRGEDGKLKWDGLDEVLKYCTDSNLNIVLLIQPEVLLFGASLPGMEIATADDLGREDVLAEYDIFLTETLRRYKDIISAIEIVNEPDINLVLHGGLTPERAGQITAEIMKRSYSIVKAEAPEMPVVGLAVSEREYFKTDAENKTQAEYIFEAAGGAPIADIFSIHPYSPKWTISDSKKYATPEEFGLHNWLTEGLAYIKDKGFTKAWVTEIGYGVESREPLISNNRKLQAALVARSLIVTKSFSDIEKGFYFSLCHGDVSTDEANMALFGPSIKYGNYFPYMGAATYAQVAYALNNTKPVATISVGGDGKFGAYQFESPGESVVAIWKDRETEEIEITGISDLVAYDMFGNVIAKGNVKVKIGNSPVYLITKAKNGESLREAVSSLIVMEEAVEEEG